MRFPDSVQTPSIRIQTRMDELGPTRIGEASGTNTVLFGAQPLTQTSASATQRLAIDIRVDGGCLTRKSLVEPSDEADGDGRNDALKHWALSSPSQK